MVRAPSWSRDECGEKIECICVEKDNTGMYSLEKCWSKYTTCKRSDVGKQKTKALLNGAAKI